MNTVGNTPTASYQASCEAGEFLVDDRGVEFGEHQGRLGDGRADRDWCPAPRTHPGVVTGDHRVGTAAVVEVTDLFDPGHRLQVAGPAVYPVNRVRCVRDEGERIVFRSTTHSASTCSGIVKVFGNGCGAVDVSGLSGER